MAGVRQGEIPILMVSVERLKNEPVSAKELEKVLNNLDANLVRALRSNGGLAGQRQCRRRWNDPADRRQRAVCYALELLLHG